MRLPLPLRGSTRLPRTPAPCRLTPDPYPCQTAPLRKRPAPPRLTPRLERTRSRAAAVAGLKSASMKPPPRLRRPFLRFLYPAPLIAMPPLFRRTPAPVNRTPDPFLHPQGIFVFYFLQKMSTSQAVKDKLPKEFPFAKRGKVMIPQKFNMGFHVTMLDKYSKAMPKRQPSAIDRSSATGMYWNDTRKFNKELYTAY